MKDISKGISREVKDSNRLIDNMGLSFEKVGNALRGTLGSLTRSVQQKTGRTGSTVCLLVVLFLGIYLFSTGKFRGSNPVNPVVNGGIRGSANAMGGGGLELRQNVSMPESPG